MLTAVWWIALGFCVTLVFGPFLCHLAALPFELVRICLDGLGDWLKGYSFGTRWRVQVDVERQLREQRANAKRPAE